MRGILKILAVMILLVGLLYIIRPVPPLREKPQFQPPPTTAIARQVPTRATPTVSPIPPVYHGEDNRVEPQLLPGPLSVIVVTDKDTVQTGEIIDAGFYIRNDSARIQKIAHFPPIIDIVESPPGFIGVYSHIIGNSSGRKLLPGEVATCYLSWDQHNLVSGEQVPCGSYCFRVCQIYSDAREVLLDNTKIGLIHIVPAYDKMNKVVVLDKTVTDYGITVTLQQVWLNDREIRIMTMDNLYPVGNTARASYNLDGGWAKNAAESIVSGYSKYSTGQLWIIPEPVPAGTREILVVIEKIGDVCGPWIFTVSLE